jgi:hypothetical protein
MDMMASWVIQNCGIDVTKLISFHALDFEPRDTDENRVLPQQHGVPAAEVATILLLEFQCASCDCK